MNEEIEKATTTVEKGIVEMNGLRYWFEYILAKEGHMCLATNDPMAYCNGFYAYSPKDPGNGKAFVIIETDDPNVYNTEPVIVEEERQIDSVVNTERLRNVPKSMKPPGTFGTSNNPKLINKWKPMLEAQGITDPRRTACVRTGADRHAPHGTSVRSRPPAAWHRQPRRRVTRARTNTGSRAWF